MEAERQSLYKAIGYAEGKALKPFAKEVCNILIILFTVCHHKCLNYNYIHCSLIHTNVLLLFSMVCTYSTLLTS